MTFPITLPPAGNLLLQLTIAAARTALLAGVAGLTLKTFGVKVPSVRLLTWKAVLIAGLLMPLLAWWVPAIPILVPGLPSEIASGSVQVVSTGSFHASTSPPRERRRVQVTPTNRVRDTRQNVSGATTNWPTRIGVVAWCAYLLVASFLLARLLMGLIVSQRLLRTATPIHDPRIPALFLPSTRAARFSESALVSVPVTLGTFTPSILLPLAWREWDQAKLQSVLSHELSHVARHDGLAKLASLLHRAIFWFSPLAWWLDRHISELAEEVSDEAALSAGAERHQYARNLLGFFNTTHNPAGRVRWQGVSMAISGDPERRLERILAWRGDGKMKVNKWIGALAIAMVIPAVYLIAAARPVPGEPPAQSATSAQQQNTPPAAGESAPALPAAPSMPSAPGMSAAPATPEAASAADAEDQASNHHNRFFYSYGDDDNQRFVIVSGKSDSFTMSGSGEDARHAQKLKKQISGDFIWFQRDEKSYIIRDAATVERARRLWAPQEELGKKQEELGKQQEALGKQQEELGARMQAVRVKVPDISAELDKLKAELKQLGPDASMEQIGRIQSEIGELQSRMGEIQSHAGDEQGKIGEEMGALGEKQGKLGAQQGELGRQQGELAEKANREMKKIFDDAIKNGTAKPETDQSNGESI